MDLNERFSELIQNFSISRAYEKIVIQKPYKILSTFVYDWSYAPLKRRQLEEVLSGPTSPKPNTAVTRKKKSSISNKDKSMNEFVFPSHR